MSAEIPLKHPLDIEFKLNRKLARQLYEQEMLNKVHLNKEQKDALREEINAQRLKKEMEKQKKQEEQVKSDLEVKEAAKQKLDEKMRSVLVNRDHGLKMRELDLKKKEKKVIARLDKLEEERQEKERKFKEDNFTKDIEHLRELNNKNGNFNQKAKV